MSAVTNATSVRPPRSPGRPCGLAGVGLLLLLASACGGGSKEKRTSQRGMAPAATEPVNLNQVGKPSVEVVAERTAAAEPAQPGKKKRRRAGPAIELPKPDEFTERDWTENDQESRDPFRNYLLVNVEKGAPEAIVDTTEVYLKDFALGELKVSGIVGSRRRYAMMLDPRSDRATILQTRDRFGRERAIIFEINRDHLVLLVPKPKGTAGDPYDRQLKYVDEVRKIVDVGGDELRPDEPGIRYSSGRRRNVKEKPARPVESKP
jgi:hypothetical protein